jgi:hypothetical protein
LLTLLVILLLDPIPRVETGKQRNDDSSLSSGSSSEPDEMTESDSQSGSSNNTSENTGSVRIITDDPLVDLEAAQNKLKKPVRRKVKTPPSRLILQIMSRVTGRPLKPDIELHKLAGGGFMIGPSTTSNNKPKEYKAVIAQKGSRAPTPDFTFDDAFRSPELLEQLGAYLSDTRSTRQSFFQWLDNSNKADGSGFRGTLTMLPMFQIIRQDSISLLKVLTEKLDEVNIQVLDETKLEDRVSLWRNLITRAQLELDQLRHSMESFFTFLQLLDPDALKVGISSSLVIQGDAAGVKATRELLELSQQFDDMQRKLQATSMLLTSNMALLESRRSIAEAHAVSKLTELAFFFIPLTFAASLFGMQIEQLENRAPLSTFLLLAIGFTAISYLVRLAIRSNWLRWTAEAYTKSITRYADKKRKSIQKGHVPATFFLRWLWSSLFRLGIKVLQHVWTLTLAAITSFWTTMEFVIVATLMVSIIVVGPLAALWTRSIASTTKDILTVIIVLLVTVLVLIPYWRASEPEVRSAIPRLILRVITPTRGHVKSRRTSGVAVPNAFIWSSALVVMGVVPLAVMWTKPLAQGIKVAVTIVIAFILIISLISWGIHRLVYSARGYDTDSEDESLLDD